MPTIFEVTVTCKTGSEGAERCFDALGGGWARRLDQSCRGRGGWGEAVSGCGGLELRVGDAAEEEETAVGGRHGALWRPDRRRVTSGNKTLNAAGTPIGSRSRAGLGGAGRARR